MTPTCPANYDCTFVPHAPKHIYDHWWDGPWGQWIALAAVIALLILLCMIVFQIAETRRAHLAFEEMSREQFLGIVEHIHAKFAEREQLPATIFIEETNLGNTLVVGGEGGVFKLEAFLAYSGGEVQSLTPVRRER
jgi:hypothetical protein